MKKIGLIVLIFTMICSLLCLAACTTTAQWGEQTQDTENAGVNVVKANGSEKYIVYASLNSSGDLIPLSDTTTVVAAYAVVGYIGLTSELVIPDQYDGKNVTKVLVAAPYTAYHCYMDGAAYTGDDPGFTAGSSKSIVTSIVFGSNVAKVGSRVCMTLEKLTSVTFLRNGAVELGERAFSYCTELTTVRFVAAAGYVTIGSNAFEGSTAVPSYEYSVS